MPLKKEIALTTAVVALSVSSINALPFKESDDAGNLWKSQFDGDNTAADKDIFGDIRSHMMSQEDLLKIAESSDLSEFDEDWLELISTDPDLAEELIGGSPDKFAKVIKSAPWWGNRAKTLDEAMGSADADVQTMAETNAELQKMYPFPEEDMEHWFTAIAQTMDHDPESQSIMQRLARGDLSHFDAAMEMARSVPDEILKDDAELQSYFDKMEKDVNDDDKIHEAYESMKKNPNLEDVVKKNSRISKMMKDEDSFKKHMKASFDLNKKSTESMIR